MLRVVFLCSLLEPMANIKISKRFYAGIALKICVIRFIFMFIKHVLPENNPLFWPDILLCLVIIYDIFETSLGFCYNIS